MRNVFQNAAKPRCNMLGVLIMPQLSLWDVVQGEPKLVTQEVPIESLPWWDPAEDPNNCDLCHERVSVLMHPTRKCRIATDKHPEGIVVGQLVCWECYAKP